MRTPPFHLEGRRKQSKEGEGERQGGRKGGTKAVILTTVFAISNFRNQTNFLAGLSFRGCLLWFEWEVPFTGSCIRTLGLQVFEKIVEPLGGGALLQEVGHWGCP